MLLWTPKRNYSQTVRVDTPNQRDLQHPRNQPPPRIPMQDLSNHTMDATMSTSSNADPSTTSDVRSWPTSNNSGRCSERHTGSHSKNRDKTTPQKQNPKRLNMLVNINGYKKLARKCPKRITYMHNMKTLCQDREHNPIHKKAFNVLIKNLKEKNPIWSRTTLDCERSITRTLFTEENSDGDRLH